MSIDAKKIAEQQFRENKDMQEVHICSNGAVYNELLHAEAFQKVLSPSEKVVSVKRNPIKSNAISTDLTKEELENKIADITKKIEKAKGIVKVNLEKALKKLRQQLESVSSEGSQPDDNEPDDNEPDDNEQNNE